MNPDVPTFRPQRVVPNPSYVRAGEEIVWQGKPTLALLASSAVGMIGMFVFMGFFFLGLLASREFALLLVPFAIIALFVLLMVLQAIRIRRTDFIVTRQSIYTRTGIIGQTVIQTTFDKITDISLKQDILGRLLGYSSLLVNTAGSGTPPVKMDGLRAALEVKNLVEAARERFLRRDEPTTAAPTRRYPRFVPDRLLVRTRCTTTKQAFKRPRSEVGASAPCPHCRKHHIVREETPSGRT